MQAYRVFNRIDRIPVEWTLLDQRWRLPTRGALIASLALGTVLARGVSVGLGIAVAVLLVAVIFFVNMHINRMDPEGLLQEATQVKLLLQTMRHPVITNGGAFTLDPNPTVTNRRKRV